MAQGQKSADEDIISGQLADLHIDVMDETDDYVEHFQQGWHAAHSASTAASSSPNQPATAQANQPAAQHIFGQNPGAAADLSGFQKPVQNPPVPSADVNNPAATPAGETTLKFFGGYSTSGQQPRTAVPSGSGTASVMGSCSTVASKVSFRSLKPQHKPDLPLYAFRSDPRFMSTRADAQYAPVPCAANEFLAFLPNIANMTKAVPMNMIPDEVLLVYETIMNYHEQQGRVVTDPEELDLYGGSVNALPGDWLHHTGQAAVLVPPPPVVPAHIPAVIPQQQLQQAPQQQLSLPSTGQQPASRSCWFSATSNHQPTSAKCANASNG